MTPKEKAQQLLDRLSIVNNSPHIAKAVALYVVHEILCANPHSSPFDDELPVRSTMDYWQAVKEEILNF